MAAVRHIINDRYSVLVEKHVSSREVVFDWYLYESGHQFAIEVGSASSFHDAVAQAKQLANSHELVRKPNPKRPPKRWMERCQAGVSVHSAKDPGAVCGSLWYRKMSPAAKRKAMREENPPCVACDKAAAVAHSQIQANPGMGTAFLWLGGAALVGWLLLRPKKSDAATTTPPSTSPPSSPSTPAITNCDVRQDMFDAWSKSQGYLGVYVTKVAQPPGYEDVVKAVPEANTYPPEKVVVVTSSLNFWSFGKNGAPAASPQLKENFCNWLAKNSGKSPGTQGLPSYSPSLIIGSF